MESMEFLNRGMLKFLKVRYPLYRVVTGVYFPPMWPRAPDAIGSSRQPRYQNTNPHIRTSRSFWRVMKKLFHVRSRSKLKNNGLEAHVYNHSFQNHGWAESRASVHLPAKVLEHIFTYLCPHTCDETYNSLEGSMTEGGCMLCNMRDLAHCTPASHEWAEIAQRTLSVLCSNAGDGTMIILTLIDFIDTVVFASTLSTTARRNTSSQPRGSADPFSNATATRRIQHKKGFNYSQEQ